MNITREESHLLEHSLHIEQDSNQVLLECIERGLGFLDDSAKKCIFWHLKNEFGLDEPDIIRRSDDFIIALNKIFGDGSKMIEKRILEEISQKFRIGDRQISSFPDAVKEVRRLVILS